MASETKGRVIVRSVTLLLFLHVCQVASYYETVSMGNDWDGDCGTRIVYGEERHQGGEIEALRHTSWECKVSIVTDVNQLIHLRFDRFHVYSEDDDCRKHYLKIYDGDFTDTYASLLTSVNGLCTTADSYGLPLPILSTGRAVTLVLYREPTEQTTDFRIIYSAVKKHDDMNCFWCAVNTSLCYDSTLKCDHMENCEDGSDETNCNEVVIPPGSGKSKEGLSTTALAVVIVVVICIVVIGIVIGFCCFFEQKKKKKKAAESNVAGEPKTYAVEAESFHTSHDPEYANLPEPPAYQPAYTPLGKKYQRQPLSNDYASKWDSEKVGYHNQHPSVGCDERHEEYPNQHFSPDYLSHQYEREPQSGYRREPRVSYDAQNEYVQVPVRPQLV
ncbi:uncharacterized protein LOC100373521 [Saccoglossus kowalevskii]|uniref:Uncharacterized protein LOC100373521 n=1 Tax=Saccoglossus kowalevskii TaxID=10224 RepID=A0ABM0GSF8_SACKO|nr:PREDICTED: uncharacterized protein LOC100373521 [Saccoglossus kowalevskii]